MTLRAAPMTVRPKEMELTMQTSYADGRWHVTIQAWLGTEAACDAMIRTLEIIKPMIAENARQAAIGEAVPAPKEG